MKSYGKLCLSKEKKHMYIAAYKDIKIHIKWFIEITNYLLDSHEYIRCQLNEYAVFDILYSPATDECDEYYYIQKTEENPKKIIWDKSFVIDLEEKDGNKNSFENG